MSTGQTTSIVKKVRVTIEKEIRIEMTPAMFGGMSVDEYLAEFRKGLWHVSSIDDVAKYAAGLAATNGGGVEWDGIGLLNNGDHPRAPDVRFEIIEDEVETEVLA